MIAIVITPEGDTYIGNGTKEFCAEHIRKAINFQHMELSFLNAFYDRVGRFLNYQIVIFTGVTGNINVSEELID